MSIRLLLVAVFLAHAAGIGAHHSLDGIYNRAVRLTLTGVVADFRLINPHPFVTIQVPRDGRLEDWKLELDNRSELTSIGVTADTLKRGDRIIVSGNRAHDGSRSMYAWRIDRPGDGFWYEQVGSSPRIGVTRSAPAVEP